MDQHFSSKMFVKSLVEWRTLFTWLEAVIRSARHRALLGFGAQYSPLASCMLDTIFQSLLLVPMVNMRLWTYWRLVSVYDSWLRSDESDNSWARSWNASYIASQQQRLELQWTRYTKEGIYTTALGADITQHGYVHYCIASVSAIEQIIQIYVRPEEMTVKLSRARNSPSGLLKDEVCTLKILWGVVPCSMCYSDAPWSGLGRLPWHPPMSSSTRSAG